MSNFNNSNLIFIIFLSYHIIDMKRKLGNNLPNLYFIILMVSLLLLLVVFIDCLIGKIHLKLESKNPESFTNLTPALTPEETAMSPEISQPPEVEDNSFMYDIDNKELDIDDFYPSPKVYQNKTPLEMLKYVFELDLFHQIIPCLDGGYLGTVWFDDRIVGIYHTPSLDKKSWKRLDKDMPAQMKKPEFISYDSDRMLLGIFSDARGQNIMFKKDCTSLESEWQQIENTNMVAFLHDAEGVMIGIDKRGRYYRKTNSKIESEWEDLEVNFESIPMRQLLYDYQTDIMMGVGQDFRIYQKRFQNWQDSEWDEPSQKSLSGSVRHIFFDSDAYIVGLSRVGLVKKKDNYYLTDFELYHAPQEKKISKYQMIYALTGIKNMAQYDDNANNNNVYVDGKKISEYQFRDPRLNKFLDFRMNLKKQCRKIKGMKVIQDNKNQMEEEQIRNQRFSRVLNEQKNTIDTLMDTIQDLKDNNF